MEEKTRCELFTEEHKELVEEGEKWAKTTANSCILVATLIATVAFAAALTVPGGNDSNTGSQIFLHDEWFMLHGACDIKCDRFNLIFNFNTVVHFSSDDTLCRRRFSIPFCAGHGVDLQCHLLSVLWKKKWRLWADALSALHATGISYLFKNRKTNYYSESDDTH